MAAFGRLAGNVAESIRKGDPVVVVGRPKVRQWENEDGVRGTDVEISAQSVAHDLSYGRTEFSKVTNGSSRSEDHQESTGHEHQTGHEQHNQEEDAQHETTETQEAAQTESTGDAAEPTQQQPAAEQAPDWKGEPELQRAD